MYSTPNLKICFDSVQKYSCSRHSSLDGSVAAVILKFSNVSILVHFTTGMLQIGSFIHSAEPTWHYLFFAFWSQYFDWRCLGFVSIHVCPGFPTANLAPIYIYYIYLYWDIKKCWFAKNMFLHKLCSLFNRINCNYKPKTVHKYQSAMDWSIWIIRIVFILSYYKTTNWLQVMRISDKNWTLYDGSAKMAFLMSGFWDTSEFSALSSKILTTT